MNDGTNAGRFCWAVRGTMCSGKIDGTYEDKLSYCSECSFFQRIKAEEGIHFQLIEPGLGTADPVALHRLLNNIVKLIGVKRDIFACLAERPLLEKITAYALAFTRSDAAAAYLLDDARRVLRLEAHAGSAGLPRRIQVRDDTPVSRAVSTRMLCRGRFNLPGLADEGNVIVIPIGGREQEIGALELLKADGTFSTDDEWFLQEFGLIAALGVANARQVEDLRQLRQFDQAKSRFVALLMHHIASPLATIACSVQALQQLGDSLPPEDREKLMASSLERIDSVQALSRKLLDLAAIRRGTSLVDIQPVWPGDPLRQEVEDRRKQASEKGIEVVVGEPQEHPPVLADPGGLRLIFGSLLNNAIKYSGAPGKTVNADVTVEGSLVRVSIRDTGIGIPLDEQTKIFDEFVRGSNVAEAKRATGFGLGMSIVKQLVGRYGGHIDLQSEIGVGTCVTVEFPVAENTGRREQ